jgi:hypothetical protein
MVKPTDTEGPGKSKTAKRMGGRLKAIEGGGKGGPSLWADENEKRATPPHVRMEQLKAKEKWRKARKRKLRENPPL